MCIYKAVGYKVESDMLLPANSSRLYNSYVELNRLSATCK